MELEEEDSVTRSAHAAGCALVLALAAAAAPARAALGESERSLERDRAALHMERRPAALKAGATVHELRGPTLSVREYVDAAGTVFAVAWSGIAPPDLSLLLGAYHGAYRAAAARTKAVRGPRRVETPEIVVETWGHGRSRHGRAWVPALVPPGANVDDVE